MKTSHAPILALSLALASTIATSSRAAVFECDHYVETTRRAISLEVDDPTGVAEHGAWVTPAITAANARCQAAPAYSQAMIRTFQDGEGWCAYPDEQILASGVTTCEDACHYVVETDLRAINVDDELPGEAAARGGYVTAHLAPSNQRCLSLGWAMMIVMFADGEGYCAYPGEAVQSSGSGPCAATCNFSVETTERLLDVDADHPETAAEHGGRVLPHLAPANERCLDEGYATMIVTFADGEGFCAEHGEQVLEATPDCQ